MLKNTIRLILAIILVFGFIACGSDNSDEKNIYQELDLKSFKIEFLEYGKVKVSWDAVEGADYYRVKHYRANLFLYSSDFPYTTVDTPSIILDNLGEGEWLISLQPSNGKPNSWLSPIIELTPNSAKIHIGEITEDTNNSEIINKITENSINGKTFKITDFDQSLPFIITFNRDETIIDVESYPDYPFSNQHRWYIDEIGKLVTYTIIYENGEYSHSEAFIHQQIGYEDGCYIVESSKLEDDTSWNKKYKLCPNPTTYNISELNKSNLPITGQQISYYSNDDGDLQTGKTRSFTREENSEYVVDNVTKLMWQDTSNVNGRENRKTWQEAVDYCESLVLSGFSDWRLPNIKELIYLAYIGKNYKNNFKNFLYINNSGFWSSTSTPYRIDGENYAHQSRLTYLSDNYILPIDYKLNVRCARGQSDIINTTLVRDNEKKIVIDTNTNLIWQDNEVVQNKKIGWKEAIKYCTNLDLAGYKNWRLPNYFELFSIGDRRRYNPAIDNVFIYVATDSAYWSSTSVDRASYKISFKTGTIVWSADNDNENDGYVRCVREN